MPQSTEETSLEVHSGRSIIGDEYIRITFLGSVYEYASAVPSLISSFRITLGNTSQRLSYYFSQPHQSDLFLDHIPLVASFRIQGVYPNRELLDTAGVWVWPGDVLAKD